MRRPRPVGRGAARDAPSTTDRAHAAASDWHCLSADATLARLGSSPIGLTSHEAAARLERAGPNRLREPRAATLRQILHGQLESLVVALLAVAAIAAYALGDRVEAAAIAAVLVLNVTLGFMVELRSRRRMEALLRFEAPRARALRDGRSVEIDARSLVPGDVVHLEAGDTAPADVRLIRATEVRADESILTGESVPVTKDVAWHGNRETPLAEHRSLVFGGTSIATGTADGVVIRTGVDSEVGRIGLLLDAVDAKATPLERRLEALSRRLIGITFLIGGAVLLVGSLRGLPFRPLVEAAIALAIAAIPEGLPAVATVALAVGLTRMARRNAYVRRLHAVEALGSATVVCTDKTGTLTANRMTVTQLRSVDRAYAVSGVGLDTKGYFTSAGEPVHCESDAVLAEALRIARNSARAVITSDAGGVRASGDPTDIALLVCANKCAVVEHMADVIADIPFAGERAFSASVHRAGAGLTAYVKGAPARVLERCTRVMGECGTRALDEVARAALATINDGMARGGIRVIALAQGEPLTADEASLRDLTFVAFAGIVDPPAPGVSEAIDRFRTAGIRTLMLTGDQRLTACGIADSLGMLAGAGDVAGPELKAFDGAALREAVRSAVVYSRVTTEDKLRIVRALQENGEVVAVLGDGVNDAAALKAADVGVAMGQRGSDVAREAAAVVLQDDSFPTIAVAIEEGRIIYDNIRKFVFYLFSCNLAEVLVLLGAIATGAPLPLLPLQILWLNLLTDTIPALALAFEPGDPDVMRRPPIDPRAAIMSGPFMRSVVFYAGLITLVTLTAFAWGLSTATPAHATTLAFVTLSLAQLFHLGNARSRIPVLTPTRIMGNRLALGAVVVVIGLQVAAVHWRPLASVLSVTPLSAADWMLTLGLAGVPAVVGQAMRSRRRGGGKISRGRTQIAGSA